MPFLNRICEHPDVAWIPCKQMLADKSKLTGDFPLNLIGFSCQILVTQKENFPLWLGNAQGLQSLVFRHPSFLSDMKSSQMSGQRSEERRVGKEWTDQVWR